MLDNPKLRIDLIDFGEFVYFTDNIINIVFGQLQVVSRE